MGNCAPQRKMGLEEGANLFSYSMRQRSKSYMEPILIQHKKTFNNKGLSENERDFQGK